MKRKITFIALATLFLSITVLGNFVSSKNQEVVKATSSQSVSVVEDANSPVDSLATNKQFPYTGIADGWNNIVTSNTDYRATILKFGQWNVDFLANDKNPNSTNRATTAYDVGNKVTINGLSAAKIHDKCDKTHIGYDHGYCFFFIVYPAEILKRTAAYPSPTLHIPEGTTFMDVTLPEVTLQLFDDVWIPTNNGGMKLSNPLDIDSYSLVELPHQITKTAHAILNGIPAEGCQLAFNIKSDNTPFTDPTYALIFDGLYDTGVYIFPSSGTAQLVDKKENNAVVKTVDGLKFKSNYDYIVEFYVVTGPSTTFKFAINHCVIFDYTLGSRSGSTVMWSVDTSNAFSIDYFEENEAYKPSIIFGGSSYYDFMEGDPVYDFSSMIGAFSLYDDTVGAKDVKVEIDDGAITDGKYNAGLWTMTLTLDLPGYEAVVKEISINVHGTTSNAKIYYDDADPIEVPIGSKLTPPKNPESYQEGDYDYVFDGWYYDGQKWDFENGIVNGDMHFESRFVAVPHRYKLAVEIQGLNKENQTFYFKKGSSVPFSLFEIDGTTFEVYLNGQQITSLIIEDDTNIVVKYIVEFTYVEAKEPTCTEDGHVGYWVSDIYAGYYFYDAKGKEVINDPVLPKLNHDIIHLDYKDSTCSEVGNVDCYYCKNCHIHFSDDKGQSELVNWSIAKKAHALTHHAAVKATCETAGNLEYYTCSKEPGVYYADEECTTKLEKVIVEALGHDYLAPTYEWSKAGSGYVCTASLKCSRCDHEIKEMKAGSKLVVREASCTREGQISYTVSFDDPRFNTQTKIINSAKTSHTYVYVAEVEATENSEGIKAHYECSECHGYFIKNGEIYAEVQYNELILPRKQAKKGGCGGSIVAMSTLISLISGAGILLVLKKRKEDK